MLKNVTSPTDYGPNHAYEVINPNGPADILFICEHASNYIPLDYNNLGLEEDFLRQHIAWDIGMEKLTRELAARLDAPAIIATFSRLLIDPNREADHATLIPPASDGIAIPGNQALTPEDINARRLKYYQAFHDRADEMVRRKIASNHAPLVCGMHSFTPQMNGFQRPWHAGMLWNKDPRLAQALIKSLGQRGYSVGDNEPYSGRDLFFTMNQHGDRHGVPHVTLEIRQDEVDTDAGVTTWADILVEDLATIARDPDIRAVKRY